MKAYEYYTMCNHMINDMIYIYYYDEITAFNDADKSEDELILKFPLEAIIVDIFVGIIDINDNIHNVHYIPIGYFFFNGFYNYKTRQYLETMLEDIYINDKLILQTILQVEEYVLNSDIVDKIKDEIIIKIHSKYLEIKNKSI